MDGSTVSNAAWVQAIGARQIELAGSLEEATRRRIAAYEAEGVKEESRPSYSRARY
jgi:hypothetical protein